MVLNVYNVLRYRYHSGRVAINNWNVRISLANWCCKKIIDNHLYQLTRDLAAFPEIHEAFSYVKRIFTTSVPKGIKDFFLTLSWPSSVSAYIYPSNESFNLLETIFNINIKGDSSVKWSDSGHFPKPQGKLIFSFPCTLFLHTKLSLWKVPWVAPFTLLLQGTKILFLDTFYFVFFKLSKYFLVS